MYIRIFVLHGKHVIINDSQYPNCLHRNLTRKNSWTCLCCCCCCCSFHCWVEVVGWLTRRWHLSWDGGLHLLKHRCQILLQEAPGSPAFRGEPSVKSFNRHLSWISSRIDMSFVVGCILLQKKVEGQQTKWFDSSLILSSAGGCLHSWNRFIKWLLESSHIYSCNGWNFISWNWRIGTIFLWRFVQ